MVEYGYVVESLRRQRERLINDYGEEGFTAHTNLLEISIISLHNRVANMLENSSEIFRSEGSIIAIGDFGRGMIGPLQPVQIVFLVTPKLEKEKEWFREVINPLEEAGWKVEWEVLTLSALTEKLSRDYSFLKKVIYMRYISGNRLIADELEAVLKEWIRTQGVELIGECKKSWVERFEMATKAEDWLELDLYSFSGGLDDIRCLRITLNILGMNRLDDAARQGILERQDIDRLQQVERFYLRILNAAGGSVLSYNVQEEVALKMGYTGRADFSAVEAFMQEVYRALHDVSRICQIFWRSIEEKTDLIGEKPIPREIRSGVFIREGSLDIDFEKFPLNPVSFVSIFRMAAQYGVPVGAKTLRHLISHRNILESSAGNRAVSEELLLMIHSDSPRLLAFRQFHDMGFFGALIPEWNSILGLAQHDFFHAFPFHEHAIRALQEVKKVLNGDYAKEEAEITRVGNRISDPRWLYLAALLHDIGKSGGRDHAIKGGEMIPPIARRLGLLPEESDMVQFLVAQHTLLMDSASMRDIGDEGMLSQCSLIIGNPVRLDLLLILTFADLKSTGPTAFEKWQRSPILFLYERIGQIIEKGEPNPKLIRDRISQISKLVKEKVSDLMDEHQLQNQLEEVSPRYLLSMIPEDIAEHLRLEWIFFNSPDPFVCRIVPRSLGKYGGMDKGWNLTIISEMTQGLLYKVAGLLTLHNLDIISAQVFVKKNGIMILDFQCISRIPDHETNWEEIQRDLKRLLEHKLALDYRLAQRAVFPRGSRPISTEVVVDNDSSEDYTILEIYTKDRPGLLYLITKTLAGFEIRVYVAKITTRGDQVADVFYVKDHLGNKLYDPDQIREIQQALIFWLDKASSIG
ncbi:MAG: HD domain-containing protein [Syntrophobacterales bacterium]|nr:HD domain-containing protein [Syntrophobacterales bacterium]